jgi:hypothetical protein
VIGLRNANIYLLSQIGNADEIPVYFIMASSYTIDDTSAESVLMKTSHNEKI